MKFANYSFHARGVNDLGDNMQIIAIDEIYKKMGVDLGDVIYIDNQDLATYKGEYVILPITMPLVDYRQNGIAGRFSPKIVPVFLGLTMVKDTLMPEEVTYYNKYSPIGCRDERTLNTLRKYGIDAYLHGCITVTLPRRNDEGERYEKVYLVDVPESLIEYIPKNLLERALVKTHIHKEHIEDPKETMRLYYQEYIDNARLVITSLLHCSVPCMAAGIPVILAKERISYRFSWLEKLIPVYDQTDFGEIDWSPNAVECEEHKKRVLEITSKALMAAFRKYSDIYDLSYYYETRKKKEYVNDACFSLMEYINTNWIDKNKCYEYSIWGLTQIAEYIVSYISDNYPNAQLMHVFDSFRKEKFAGLVSERPENIVDYLEEVVFVTTNGAEKAAIELFNKIKKPKNTYAFMKVVL
jgi:hypothetical protein